MGGVGEGGGLEEGQGRGGDQYVVIGVTHDTPAHPLYLPTTESHTTHEGSLTPNTLLFTLLLPRVEGLHY